jgi:hypothetical protein
VKDVSEIQIVCAFDLTDQPAGSKWDVVVKVGENEGKKPGAFSVTE